MQVSGNTVSILSDIAELADQTDRQRAVRAMEAAEESRARSTTQKRRGLSRAHARLNATGGLAGTTQGAH